MAAAIWIVRANKEPHTLIDGIDVVFINNDNLDNEATTIADATAAVQAAGHAIGPNYFTSAQLALSAGAMDVDGDCVICKAREEVLA